ncbi:DUF2510 domain-containing protein [Schumannella sp. 10F1B-5-1]|uniref:DUF2510 domain-containing protein n=1 Tax=Schumannella sp. 10F1B-5-1 TaxID=2590780 RepID=UPI001131728C|nr:DUF2510 domain-containing protein [Schumannella sp. 10F1B-5-1]TPW76711.1 DUF2510 domain-containing protein [Schumannella sp. 10F1B-5-1]
MTDTTTTPSPGWYADPADAARLRWWNGVGWSQQTRDRAGTRAVDAATGPAAGAPARAAASATAPAPASAFASPPAAAVAQPPLSSLLAVTHPASPYASNEPLEDRAFVPQSYASSPYAAAVAAAAAAPAEPTVAATPWSRDPAARPAPAAPTALPAMAAFDPTARYSTGSMHTVPGWMLAVAPLTTPLIVFALFFALGVAGIDPGIDVEKIPRVVLIVVNAIPLVILAAIDAQILKSRGFDAPNPLAAIPVGPIFYMHARGKAVKAMGAVSWPITLVTGVSLVAGIAVTLAIVLLGQWAGAVVDQQAADVTHSIEADMKQQSGVDWMLSCPGGSDAFDYGATVTCTASGSDGTSSTVTIQISQSGDVRYQATQPS